MSPVIAAGTTSGVIYLLSLQHQEVTSELRDAESEKHLTRERRFSKRFAVQTAMRACSAFSARAWWAAIKGLLQSCSPSAARLRAVLRGWCLRARTARWRCGTLPQPSTVARVTSPRLHLRSRTTPRYWQWPSRARRQIRQATPHLVSLLQVSSPCYPRLFEGRFLLGACNNTLTQLSASVCSGLELSMQVRTKELPSWTCPACRARLLGGSPWQKAV